MLVDNKHMMVPVNSFPMRGDGPHWCPYCGQYAMGPNHYAVCPVIDYKGCGSEEGFGRQLPDPERPRGGWIGVDLDGTLAEYHGEQNYYVIGDPIPSVLEEVKRLIQSGTEVRIFTARANLPSQIPLVRCWLDANGLPGLVITATKDFEMIELWDDRCVQFVPNTGVRAVSYNGGNS